MKKRSLKSSIWIVNVILVFLYLGLLMLLSGVFYYSHIIGGDLQFEVLSKTESFQSLSTGGKMFMLFLYVLENGALIFIFHKLKSFLKVVSISGPFEKSTYKFLKPISKAVIAVFVLKILTVLSLDILNDRISLSFDTTSLYFFLLLSMIYVLSDVFKYGNSLIEDQKLTI